MKKLLFSFLAICLCLGLLPVNVSASEITDTSSVSEVVQPASLVTGEEDISDFPSYDLTIPVSSRTLIVPIKMNYMGQLKVNLVGNVVTGGIEVNLYSDADCTNKVGYSGNLSTFTLENVVKADIPKKGTYYLKFDLSQYAEDDSTVSITPYSFSSEDKTLKNKEWIGSHGYSYDSQIKHKITITTPGYIAVEGASLADNSIIYVTLCNSKNAKLSDQIYLSSSKKYTTYFAVNKGTYYITAKSYDDYKLRYTFTATKDNSNTSQVKATLIPKGKTAQGLILSEDSVNKVDWYKVKLSKKQALSFNVNAKSCDSIKFEIVPASKNIVLMGSSFRIYDAGGDTYYTKDSMPAGTYYIKVTKTDKTSSGYYSIKFN